jgi:hypothetical protein
VQNFYPSENAHSKQATTISNFSRWLESERHCRAALGIRHSEVNCAHLSMTAKMVQSKICDLERTLENYAS